MLRLVYLLEPNFYQTHKDQEADSFFFFFFLISEREREDEQESASKKLYIQHLRERSLRNELKLLVIRFDLLG